MVTGLSTLAMDEMPFTELLTGARRNPSRCHGQEFEPFGMDWTGERGGWILAGDYYPQNPQGNHVTGNGPVLTSTATQLDVSEIP